MQLEQKLKLQRVELQKQANMVQGQEDKARAELHEVTVRAGGVAWGGAGALGGWWERRGGAGRTAQRPCTKWA